MVHCDLAARNCLVSIAEDGTEIVKISDFGLARELDINNGELNTYEKIENFFYRPKKFIFKTIKSRITNLGLGLSCQFYGTRLRRLCLVWRVKNVNLQLRAMFGATEFYFSKSHRLGKNLMGLKRIKS